MEKEFYLCFLGIVLFFFFFIQACIKFGLTCWIPTVRDQYGKSCEWFGKTGQ